MVSKWGTTSGMAMATPYQGAHEQLGTLWGLEVRVAWLYSAALSGGKAQNNQRGTISYVARGRLHRRRGIRIWIRNRPAKMSCLQQLVLDSACIAVAGAVSHFVVIRPAYTSPPCFPVCSTRLKRENSQRIVLCLGLLFTEKRINLARYDDIKLTSCSATLIWMFGPRSFRI